MYFYLLQADYQNFNIFKSFFFSGKDEYPVYVILNKNELSVFSIKTDLSVPLAEQKIDIFNLNMSAIDDMEQFFLEINTNGFRNNVQLIKSGSSTNKTKKFSFVKYGELFPNKEIFYPNNQKNNYPIEFLYCLIEDIFDILSEFNKNNPEECIHYRKIFQQSKIFEYINKKRLFYKSLFEYQQSQQVNKKNEQKKKPEKLEDNPFYQELIKSYGQFLNLLLKNEMLAYIPCEIFEKDNWFLLNPEKEIIQLSSFNEQYHLVSSTIPQIQNFLLKKHDILNAILVGKKNKKFNPFYLQIISSLIFGFTSYSWLENKDFSERLLVFGALISALSILISAYSKKKINHNLIMLRFGFSIISAWVIFITVGDIFQSFMNVNESLFHLLILLIPLIIFAATHIEVHIQSPYHLSKDFFKIFLRKTFPIFVYAFNLAFISGILFNVFFISKYVDDNNLIRNGKYIRNKLDSIDQKIKNNYELIDMLKVIESNYIHSLNNKKNTEFINNISHSYQNDIKKYNICIENNDLNLKALDSIINDSNYKVLLGSLDAIQNNQTNLKKLNQLFENDSILQSHVSSLSNDTISIKWNNIFKNNKITNSTSETYQFSRKQRVSFGVDSGIYFKLFLLQMMLVMTFAIVGQAIISKDTITEPL